MKCVPQIKYIPIDKRLELQNSTWSVRMWFQYDVKPRWVVAWNQRGPGYLPRGMSLHAVCMRVYKALRVGAGGPWRIRCRPTISQTCSMGDMFGERAGQGSSDTRRRWKKACTILATCGRALSCWNIACGVALPRAVKPPWCSGCCSDCPQHVGVEIAYFIQCRTKPLH